MNAMTKLEQSEIQTARIRALQGIYSEAHRALENWGAYSRDTRGIYPVEAHTSIYDQMREDDRAGWGEEKSDYRPVIVKVVGKVKADRPEEERYDQKQAEMLDFRMHAPGGLPEGVRLVLKQAYVLRAAPEYQWPSRCSCSWDAVCERLEEALRFVGRWI